MTHEYQPRPYRNQAAEVYGFTKREQLYNYIGDAHFQSILDDETTTVHQITIDSNNFGEFLFITTSRPRQQSRILVTFYGLGQHEQREQWLTEMWSWYEAHPFPKVISQELDKSEAKTLIQARRDEIAPYITSEPSSDRAKLFATIADITDEDYAYSEIDDLLDLLDHLSDGE